LFHNGKDYQKMVVMQRGLKNRPERIVKRKVGGHRSVKMLRFE